MADETVENTAQNEAQSKESAEVGKALGSLAEQVRMAVSGTPSRVSLGSCALPQLAYTAYQAPLAGCTSSGCAGACSVGMSKLR